MSTQVQSPALAAQESIFGPAGVSDMPGGTHSDPVATSPVTQSASAPNYATPGSAANANAVLCNTAVQLQIVALLAARNGTHPEGMEQPGEPCRGAHPCDEYPLEYPLPYGTSPFQHIHGDIDYLRRHGLQSEYMCSSDAETETDAGAGTGAGEATGTGSAGVPCSRSGSPHEHAAAARAAGPDAPRQQQTSRPAGTTNRGKRPRVEEPASGSHHGGGASNHGSGQQPAAAAAWHGAVHLEKPAPTPASARPPKKAKARAVTCTCCGGTNTPLWREGKNGVRLCNACGIRWVKYGISCTSCEYVPRKMEGTNPLCPKCDAKLPPAEPLETRRKMSERP